MRIGIIREFMVKHAKVDEPIVDAAAAEMKAMLAGHLGATLVESVTAGWVDDPDVENMTTTFDRAIAEIVPVLFPDFLYRLTPAREPQFPDFAARVRPTPFAPGVTKGTGTLASADWMVRWAEGLEPTPRNLTLRDLLGGGGDTGSRSFRFHIPQYLTRRAKDWADRGFKETLVDWPSLNARSKFWGDDQRAAFKNWEDLTSLHRPPKGIAENIQRRELLRRILMKVMYENKLDVLIQVHTALPPARIGLAPEPVVDNRAISYPLGPNAGLTEILIPAGYVRTVVRSEVRARDRRQRAQGLPKRHQHGRYGDSGAGPAVLDQFPGRAGNGASGVESGHRLSGGLATARAAADVSGSAGRAITNGAIAKRPLP